MKYSKRIIFITTKTFKYYMYSIILFFIIFIVLICNSYEKFLISKEFCKSVLSDDNFLSLKNSNCKVNYGAKN